MHICTVCMYAVQMGDDFELHEYARKTPLVAAEESLKGSYAKVQPGEFRWIYIPVIGVEWLLSATPEVRKRLISEHILQ